MIKDLIEHKLPGYYFLPRISPDLDIEGVVLMREIYHIPSTVCGRIAGGLSRDDALTLDADCLRYFSFTQDDFVMPVGEVVSPSIEHLLQSFSNLFGRIGLQDHDQTAVERVVSRDYRREIVV